MRERKREEKGGERGRRREEEETGMERQGKITDILFHILSM